jgi:hypothetical protein
MAQPEQQLHFKSQNISCTILSEKQLHGTTRENDRARTNHLIYVTAGKTVKQHSQKSYTALPEQQLHGTARATVKLHSQDNSSTEQREQQFTAYTEEQIHGIDRRIFTRHSQKKGYTSQPEGQLHGAARRNLLW